MTFSSLIVPTTSFLTLLSHIALALFALGLLLRVPAIKAVRRFFAKNVLALSAIVSASAFLGSLLYSEILLFEPCVLCWIGRAFIYPQVVLTTMALYFKDNGIVKYLLGLSIIGAIVSLYHSFTQLGGFSLTPCTAEGGSCSILYVLEYGYITIPMMSFTAFLIIIVMVLCNMYESR